MPGTAPSTLEDPATLQGFLDRLPHDARLPARTVVHAWMHAGGQVRIGRVAVRLLGQDAGATPFTAGTVHAPTDGRAPFLELCRVILQGHGVGEAEFTHWADELAHLQHLGFEPTAKFPAVPLDGRLVAADMASLAGALRDLARMLQANADAAPDPAAVPEGDPGAPEAAAARSTRDVPDRAP